MSVRIDHWVLAKIQGSSGNEGMIGELPGERLDNEQTYIKIEF